MVAQNLIDAVLALPAEEQAELFERLGRRLGAVGGGGDAAAFETTDEHRRVLAERMEEFRRDPAEGEPWEVVRARLAAKLRG